jgi:hypothetical protein
MLWGPRENSHPWARGGTEPYTLWVGHGVPDGGQNLEVHGCRGCSPPAPRSWLCNSVSPWLSWSGGPASIAFLGSATV